MDRLKLRGEFCSKVRAEFPMVQSQVIQIICSRDADWTLLVVEGTILSAFDALCSHEPIHLVPRTGMLMGNL